MGHPIVVSYMYPLSGIVWLPQTLPRGWVYGRVWGPDYLWYRRRRHNIVTIVEGLLYWVSRCIVQVAEV